MSQLALALCLYVEDTQEYPHFDFGPWRWPDFLAAYTRGSWTNDLYRCPDYRGFTTFPKLNARGSGATHLLGSYGYNGRSNNDWPNNLDLGLASTGDKSAPFRPVLPSDVQVPSDMIALGDASLVPTDWVRNHEPVK